MTRLRQRLDSFRTTHWIPVLLGLGAMLLAAWGCQQSPTAGHQQNDSRPSPNAEPLHPEATDSYPLSGTRYNELTSRDGKWKAYIEYNSDPWQPMTLHLEGPDYTKAITAAYPHSLDPTSSVLLYSATPEGNAPALFSISLVPPYTIHQLTNLNMQYTSGPMPVEFIPNPEGQEITWTGRKASYSPSEGGIVTIDLTTGEARYDRP